MLDDTYDFDEDEHRRRRRRRCVVAASPLCCCCCIVFAVLLAAGVAITISSLVFAFRPVPLPTCNYSAWTSWSYQCLELDDSTDVRPAITRVMGCV